MNRSDGRLNSTGFLNRVLEGDGIAFADTLARLSDREFEKEIAALRASRGNRDIAKRLAQLSQEDAERALTAFRLYRQDVRAEPSYANMPPAA